MGFFENYVSGPVNDLFSALIEKGLDREWTFQHWNHPKEGLPSEFHMFAGNYHHLPEGYKPFEFRTNCNPMEVALSPPLTAKTVSNSPGLLIEAINALTINCA